MKIKNCLLNKKNTLELIHGEGKNITGEAMECLNNYVKKLILKSCGNAGNKKTVILVDVARINIRAGHEI